MSECMTLADDTIEQKDTCKEIDAKDIVEILLEEVLTSAVIFSDKGCNRIGDFNITEDFCQQFDEISANSENTDVDNVKSERDSVNKDLNLNSGETVDRLTSLVTAKENLEFILDSLPKKDVDEKVKSASDCKIITEETLADNELRIENGQIHIETNKSQTVICTDAVRQEYFEKKDVIKDEKIEIEYFNDGKLNKIYVPLSKPPETKSNELLTSSSEHGSKEENIVSQEIPRNDNNNAEEITQRPFAPFSTEELRQVWENANSSIVGGWNGDMSSQPEEVARIMEELSSIQVLSSSSADPNRPRTCEFGEENVKKMTKEIEEINFNQTHNTVEELDVASHPDGQGDADLDTKSFIAKSKEGIEKSSNDHKDQEESSKLRTNQSRDDLDNSLASDRRNEEILVSSQMYVNSNATVNKENEEKAEGTEKNVETLIQPLSIKPNREEYLIESESSSDRSVLINQFEGEKSGALLKSVNLNASFESGKEFHFGDGRIDKDRSLGNSEEIVQSNLDGGFLEEKGDAATAKRINSEEEICEKENLINRVESKASSIGPFTLGHYSAQPQDSETCLRKSHKSSDLSVKKSKLSAESSGSKNVLNVTEHSSPNLPVRTKSIKNIEENSMTVTYAMWQDLLALDNTKDEEDIFQNAKYFEGKESVEGLKKGSLEYLKKESWGSLKKGWVESPEKENLESLKKGSVEYLKNESQESLERESVEGLKKGSVESPEKETVTSLKKENLESPEKQRMENLEKESLESLKKEWVETPKNRSVVNLKKESQESLENETMASPKKENLESSEKQVVESLEKESLGSLKQEWVESPEKQRVDNLEKESQESLKKETMANPQNKNLESPEKQRVENLGKESLESLKKEWVETPKNRSVVNLKKESQESLENETMASPKKENLESSEKQVVESLEKGSVANLKKESQESFEKENLEKEWMESPKKESVEYLKKESHESLDRETVASVKKKSLESLKKENVANLKTTSWESLEKETMASPKKENLESPEEESLGSLKKEWVESPKKGSVANLQKENQERLEKESLESLKKGSVEGPEKEWVESPKKESVEYLKKESQEGLERETMASVKKESLESLNKGSVESPEKQRVENLEKESLGSLEKEWVESPKKGSVEYLTKESQEGLEKETVASVKKESWGSLKKESMESLRKASVANLKKENLEKEWMESPKKGSVEYLKKESHESLERETVASVKKESRGSLRKVNLESPEKQGVENLEKESLESLKKASVANLKKESLGSLERETVASVKKESRESLKKENLESPEKRGVENLEKESLGSLKKESLGSLRKESLGSLERETGASVKKESRGSLKKENLESPEKRGVENLEKESLGSLKKASMGSLRKEKVESLNENIFKENSEMDSLTGEKEIHVPFSNVHLMTSMLRDVSDLEIITTKSENYSSSADPSRERFIDDFEDIVNIPHTVQKSYLEEESQNLKESNSTEPEVRNRTEEVNSDVNSAELQKEYLANQEYRDDTLNNPDFMQDSTDSEPSSKSSQQMFTYKLHSHKMYLSSNLEPINFEECKFILTDSEEAFIDSTENVIQVINPHENSNDEDSGTISFSLLNESGDEGRPLPLKTDRVNTSNLSIFSNNETTFSQNENILKRNVFSGMTTIGPMKNLDVDPKDLTGPEIDFGKMTRISSSRQLAKDIFPAEAKSTSSGKLFEERNSDGESSITMEGEPMEIGSLINRDIASLTKVQKVKEVMSYHPKADEDFEDDDTLTRPRLDLKDVESMTDERFKIPDVNIPLLSFEMANSSSEADKEYLQGMQLVLSGNCFSNNPYYEDDFDESNVQTLRNRSVVENNSSELKKLDDVEKPEKPELVMIEEARNKSENSIDDVSEKLSLAMNDNQELANEPSDKDESITSIPKYGTLGSVFKRASSKLIRTKESDLFLRNSKSLPRDASHITPSDSLKSILEDRHPSVTNVLKKSRSLLKSTQNLFKTMSQNRFGAQSSSTNINKQRMASSDTEANTDGNLEKKSSPFQWKEDFSKAKTLIMDKVGKTFKTLDRASPQQSDQEIVPENKELRLAVRNEDDYRVDRAENFRKFLPKNPLTYKSQFVRSQMSVQSTVQENASTASVCDESGSLERMEKKDSKSLLDEESKEETQKEDLGSLKNKDNFKDSEKESSPTPESLPIPVEKSSEKDLTSTGKQTEEGESMDNQIEEPPEYIVMETVQGLPAVDLENYTYITDHRRDDITSTKTETFEETKGNEDGSESHQTEVSNYSEHAPTPFSPFESDTEAESDTAATPSEKKVRAKSKKFSARFRSFWSSAFGRVKTSPKNKDPS